MPKMYPGVCSEVILESPCFETDPTGNIIRPAFIGITKLDFFTAHQKDYNSSSEANNRNISLNINQFELDCCMPLALTRLSLLDERLCRIAVCTELGRLYYFEICNLTGGFNCSWTAWREYIASREETPEFGFKSWKVYIRDSTNCYSESDNGVVFLKRPATFCLVASTGTQTNIESDRYTGTRAIIESERSAGTQKMMPMSTRMPNKLQKLLKLYRGLCTEVILESPCFQLGPTAEIVRHVYIGVTNREFLIAQQKISVVRRHPSIMSHPNIDLDLQGFELISGLPLACCHFSLWDDRSCRFVICTNMGSWYYFEMCNVTDGSDALWAAWRAYIASRGDHFMDFGYKLWPIYPNDNQSKGDHSNVKFLKRPAVMCLVESVGTQACEEFDYFRENRKYSVGTNCDNLTFGYPKGLLNTFEGGSLLEMKSQVYMSITELQLLGKSRHIIQVTSDVSLHRNKDGRFEQRASTVIGSKSESDLIDYHRNPGTLAESWKKRICYMLLQTSSDSSTIRLSILFSKWCLAPDMLEEYTNISLGTVSPCCQAIFKYRLNVAEDCYNSQNLLTLASILKSLYSLPVLRLTDTWEIFRKQYEDSDRTFKEAFNPCNNFKANALEYVEISSKDSASGENISKRLSADIKAQLSETKVKKSCCISVPDSDNKGSYTLVKDSNDCLSADFKPQLSETKVKKSWISRCFKRLFCCISVPD